VHICTLIFVLHAISAAVHAQASTLLELSMHTTAYTVLHNATVTFIATPSTAAALLLLLMSMLLLMLMLMMLMFVLHYTASDTVTLCVCAYSLEHFPY
jgi:hypothetical protein